MAVLAVDDGSKGIQSVTLVAASGGGDQVPAGIRLGGWELPVVLVANNRDAATKTVTVAGVNYVVPVTVGLALIPIRGSYKYGDLVTATYSAVTNLFVGAVRLSGPLE